MATLIAFGLSACGNSSIGSSNSASRAGTPELFNLEEEDKIVLAVTSATDEAGVVTSNTYAGEQFWVKVSEEGTRIFRYGRPGSGNPQRTDIRRHNTRIPLTTVTENGVKMNSGTLVLTAPDDLNFLPDRASERVFNLNELELPNSNCGRFGRRGDRRLFQRL